MIDEAAQFIVKHMDMGATIEGMKRSDFSEYPLVAVREAITNAIVHRDYTVDSSQTRIFIFDDRIEVYTPGGLSTGVTIDNIEYTQYSRNRAITNILMDMGQYIEKLGTGIRRMKQAIKQSGLKEPRFFDTGIDFIVTLFGPADKEWQVKKQERIEKIQQTMAVTKTPQEIVRLTNKRERQKHRRNDTMLEALIRRVSEKKPLVQMISAAVILIILATTVIISHVRRNNPVIQYRNASLLHHDKQYDRAIRGYKDFLKRFPYDKKAADAQYYIAACFEILGDNINALKSYDALLKKYPSSPWAIYARHAKMNIRKY
ncbi:MAG: tetratricopeptide repeat protein [Candidatus Omnitrophica bacterium]|nr:tetratricopeptide repeat protein [Candidatus Omnitrophota bacterium]